MFNIFYFFVVVVVLFFTLTKITAIDFGAT